MAGIGAFLQEEISVALKAGFDPKKFISMGIINYLQIQYALENGENFVIDKLL